MCSVNPPASRVLLIGASNVANSFPLILGLLQQALPAPLELVAVYGHGRALGDWSRVCHRALPGIMECGVWNHLQDAPRCPQYALLTDIGNDLVYGKSVAQILDWTEACLERIQQQRFQITLTGLPLASIRRMGPARYWAMKWLFFPRRQVPSPAEMQMRAIELDTGLHRLAETFGSSFVAPILDWYGLDVIHIRRSFRLVAWQEILSAWADFTPAGIPPQTSAVQSIVRQNPTAERRKVWGAEQHTPQPVYRSAELRLYLY